MSAEIISIGTELTTGAKLDTNSQWLSLELSAVGIPVEFHTTVADDLSANVAVLRAAIARADVLVITGGLGPTLDDLTRDALAQVLGVPLVRHEPSLETIRAMFARRHREMPARNVIQAMFPEGTEPIPNPRGTAPGIYAEVPRSGGGACRVAALPGVPSEMRPMFRDWVLPRLLRSVATGRVIRHARINCFGLGESAAEELLGDITARGRDPEVGITVHEATITLRIVAVGATADEVERKIAATRQAICERMGEYAFGTEEEELEHVVLRVLAARGLTLATIEAATGGLLAHRLTDVSGGIAAYRGGLVAPTLGDAGALLGTQGAEWLAAGPVSAAVATALATQCRARCNADFALAVTERSRTDDHESVATAPIVCLALASPSGVEARELNIAGDPAIAKSRIAKSALNLLRLRLLRELPAPSK